jgi:GntR family transcriptional repressor for pyruvate dehydrogenase complex
LPRKAHFLLDTLLVFGILVVPPAKKQENRVEDMLRPIRKESLKDVFVARFEDLILSGKFSIGEKLPSERELALRLGVSRPVVHDGLMDLVSKGLLSMKPRVGTVVNDYRREGSLSILTSLVNYQDGKLDPRLFESMVEMRMLFEVETARLAASRRTGEQLDALRGLLEEEAEADSREIDRIAEVDFGFHHLVAMATGNFIYPLLLNSFRQVYTSFTKRFFSDPEVVTVVFGLHRELVQAIEGRDEKRAMEAMRRLLVHGRDRLKAMTAEEERGQP